MCVVIDVVDMQKDARFVLRESTMQVSVEVQVFLNQVQCLGATKKSMCHEHDDEHSGKRKVTPRIKYCQT